MEYIFLHIVIEKFKRSGFLPYIHSIYFEGRLCWFYIILLFILPWQHKHVPPVLNDFAFKGLLKTAYDLS